MNTTAAAGEVRRAPNLFDRLVQRFRDWRHERRILVATRRYVASWGVLTPEQRGVIGNEWRDLITARSIQQRERMHRRSMARIEPQYRHKFVDPID